MTYLRQEIWTTQTMLIIDTIDGIAYTIKEGFVIEASDDHFNVSLELHDEFWKTIQEQEGLWTYIYPGVLQLV